MFYLLYWPSVLFQLVYPIPVIRHLAIGLWYTAYPFGLLVYWLVSRFRKMSGAADEGVILLGMNLWFWILTPLLVWFFWHFDLHFRFWITKG
jgi:hypothetical protein